MGSCVSKPEPSPLSVGTGESGELSFGMAPVRPSGSGGEERERAALPSHENPSNSAPRGSNSPHTSRPNDDAAQSIRDMLRGRELGQRVRESRSGTCPSPRVTPRRSGSLQSLATCPRARVPVDDSRTCALIGCSPLTTHHAPRTTHHRGRRYRQSWAVGRVRRDRVRSVASRRMGT